MGITYDVIHHFITNSLDHDVIFKLNDEIPNLLNQPTTVIISILKLKTVRITISFSTMNPKKTTYFLFLIW